MRSIGLKAEVIDATGIPKFTDKRFDKVFAQALSPQVRRNKDLAEQTYISIHDALRPHGRFIFWFAETRTKHHEETYDSRPEILRMIEQQGLFRVLDLRRSRFLPARAYNLLPKEVAFPIDTALARAVRHTTNCYVLERRA